ncbi:MAG: phosphatidylinositol-3-phosphatase [Vulcanimicrobiaceae bacterium]
MQFGSLVASHVRSFASAATLAAAIVIATAAPAASLPHPSHVVVVVEENKSFGQIIGNARAPAINRLVKRAALFTNAHGVTHPSLPNYLAMFAGVTNDNGDGCPATGISKTAPNLGSELHAAHRSFAGFSEALPVAGSTVCAAGTYARKHAPWVAFANVPRADHRTFAQFPRTFERLPTVSFVIPDVDDDMHDGTIAAGDAWLGAHLAALMRWADTHDTLLVVTWDEGFDPKNTVATLLYGPMIVPGTYAQRISHYDVLRTIEDFYGLAPTGHAKEARAIAGCWR